MTEWLHFHFSFSCIEGLNGNPLHCSCLENPRDRGAWWASVYGAAQSRTRLKWLSSSSSLSVSLEAVECAFCLVLMAKTARRSNQSILKETSPGCSLEVLMLRLKLQYFGHLMWRTDSLEKTLMLGVIEGGKRRGQQRMRWLDGITDSMGLSLKLKTILNSHSSSDFQSVSLWIYRFVWIIIRLLWCSNCSQLAIGSP